MTKAVTTVTAPKCAAKRLQATASSGMDRDDAAVFHESESVPCVSRGENRAEISSSKIGWGGSRSNSGGPRANAGGPRENSGGSRPGAGRKPDTPVRAIQTMPRGPRWFVVQTEIGADSRVVRDLLDGEDRDGRPPRQKFEVEVPMTLDVVLDDVSADGKRVPMFPGYVLVRFDPEVDDWLPIRDLDGVRTLFMTKSFRPIPLPDGFVEELIADAPVRLGHETLKKRRKSRARSKGDVLRVESGPFTSFNAICIECDGVNTRAEVSIFGRSSPITAPWDWFEKA